MKKVLIILLVLSMTIALSACGGGQTDGNANDESNLYEAFLTGEANLYGDRFDVTYWDGEADVNIIDSDEGFSLAEFVEKIYKTSYLTSLSLTEINSTMIDCGNDGVPEMAVEIVLTDQYEDILTRELIIKEIDGKLQLCYATESYYRYYEHLITNDGLISSGGSSGAISYAQGYGVVDGEGEYHTICLEDGEYCLGAYYCPSEAIQNAAEKYVDEINENSLLRTITFYDSNDEEEKAVYGVEPEDDELAVRIFAEAGETITSKADIDNMLAEHLSAYGVEAIEETLDWEPVDLEIAGLSDIAKYGFNPVFVSNVSELVDAIDDDVTVVLAPGTYNLTQWMSENQSAYEEYSEQTQDSVKGVCNTVYGDYEFGIANISGLTIVSRDDTNPAQIVSEPRYYHVINFLNGSGNKLENLIIGHTPEPGICSGDVVAFNDSYDCMIDGCDLYGCGAFGIFADSCGDIKCTYTVIHDCTYGLVEAFYGSYVTFMDCIFKDCDGYSMIDLFDSSAYFQGCTFSNLKPDMLWMDSSSFVNFYDCEFDEACAESIDSYTGEGNITIN